MDDDDGMNFDDDDEVYFLVTAMAFFVDDRQHVYFGAYFNQRALPI